MQEVEVNAARRYGRFRNGLLIISTSYNKYSCLVQAGDISLDHQTKRIVPDGIQELNLQQTKISYIHQRTPTS